MITDCPSCLRQFRIYAWQLSAAKGIVQCGFCGEQFNALERLHDDLHAHDNQADGPLINDGELDEPQFEIPGKKYPVERMQPEAEDVNLQDDKDSIPSELDHDISDSQSAISDDDALEILGPVIEKRPLWNRLLWYLSVFLLVLTLILQITWFNRDFILTRYPQYSPLAREFCDRFECELVRGRDLSSIVLINRDVRDHPRYVDALLVNATIENQSDIVQPYPGLRLTLYDTEGRITGYRIFTPGEYLDDSIPVDDGMPVNMPVHIVIEVTGAKDVAVSFEFNFI